MVTVQNSKLDKNYLPMDLSPRKLQKSFNIFYECSRTMNCIETTHRKPYFENSLLTLTVLSVAFSCFHRGTEASSSGNFANTPALLSASNTTRTTRLWACAPISPLTESGSWNTNFSFVERFINMHTRILTAESFDSSAVFFAVFFIHPQQRKNFSKEDQ